MLITFMRTRIGADETVFLRYLLGAGVAFQNFDETTYGHFHARTLPSRMTRRLLRPRLSKEMAEDVEGQLARHDIKSAFVFNGRGVTQRVCSALSGLDRIVWFNPDFLPHSEHRPFETVASRVIFAKPHEYNTVRFGDRVPCNRIVNINPVQFSTKEAAGRFVATFNPRPLSTRTLDVGFLGNYSAFKREALEALAGLIRRRIAVVGEGWVGSRQIVALGPTYGPHLREIFSHIRVGVAITDSAAGRVDPITVRYFQYPLLGTVPVWYRNAYNRRILAGGDQSLCFENLVEARDRIEAVLKMTDHEYEATLRTAAKFVVRATPTAEDVLTRWVLHS